MDAKDSAQVWGLLLATVSELVLLVFIALVALLNGEAPNPSPTLINTCYSMVSDKLAVHVASVHKYDTKDRTLKPVPGAGGVSSAMNEAEGGYTMNWARNIWADMLA